MLERVTCDWSRLDGAKVTVDRLIFSEFDGGNQQIALTPSLLSIPEFKVFSTSSTPLNLEDGLSDFEIDVFTPMGPPAFWCFYARDKRLSKDVDAYVPHPTIQEMSIKCVTTGKKSDTIDLASAAELYFATQRNVHPAANYTSNSFNSRQTVLLTSEDVGTMGLSPYYYQREKRAKYKITGRCDADGRETVVTAVLVYTNRGLEISGKQLHMVYLNE